MNTESYEEICNHYYALSTKDIPSPEDEKKIVDILELAIEDSYLSTCIDQIDDKIYQETIDIPQRSETDLITDVVKIKSFILNYSDKEQSRTDRLTNDTSELRDSSSQNLINYVRTISTDGSPPEVLQAFRELFIVGNSYRSASSISSSLWDLASRADDSQSFSVAIHDCLYTVINEWLTKPNYHIFIAQLISLFEQREILKFSHNQPPCIRKALLDFTQTEPFIHLFRLANCVGYQVYSQTETREKRHQASQRPHDKPLVKKASVSPLLVGYDQSSPAASDFSIKVRPAVVDSGHHNVKLQADTSSPHKSWSERQTQPSAQTLFRYVHSKIRRIFTNLFDEGKGTRPASSTFLGVVTSPISSEQLGKVKVHGVYWTAKLSANSPESCVQIGEQIKVVSQNELTLLVEAYAPIPQRQVEVLREPINELAEGPISFGKTGRVKIQGVTKRAKLHEGFAYARLYTNQRIKVVAKEGDLLIVTPQDPVKLTTSSYKVNRSPVATHAPG